MTFADPGLVPEGEAAEPEGVTSPTEIVERDPAGATSPAEGVMPGPDAAEAASPHDSDLSNSSAPGGRIATGLRLLGLYTIVRLVLAVADVLAAHVSYGSNLAGPLLSWDSHWYLIVAAHGYPAVAPTVGGQLTYSAAGFLPVFPLLIRLFTTLGLPPVTAALTVSVIAGAMATLLVWRLATKLVDARTGWNAAVLFMLFPGMGVSWGLLYCESVGLALAAGSLLLMVRGQWLWAGVVGALATATSPLALPLALAAAVPALQGLRRAELRGAWLTVFLVPTGFVGYVAALGLHYHDLSFWWRLQTQAWGASVDFGRSLLGLLPHFWKLGYQGPAWLEWMGVAAVVAVVLALWRAKLPGCINAYCIGVLVLLFASDSLGFKPRLLTWAFPAFIAVAAVLKQRTWLATAIAFACLLPIVFLAYTLLGNSMAQP